MDTYDVVFQFPPEMTLALLAVAVCLGGAIAWIVIGHSRTR